MNPHRRSTKNRRRPASQQSDNDDNISMMSSLSSISSKSSRSTSMSSSFLLPQHQTHASNSTAAAAANKKDSKKRLAGAVILALCLLNILDGDMFVRQSNTTGGRRSLLSSLYLAGPSTLLPWAQHHLVDVTERPDPEAETALFWRKFCCCVTLYAFLLLLCYYHVGSRKYINNHRHSKIRRNHRQTPLPMHGPNPRPSRRRRSKIRPLGRIRSSRL